MDVVNILLVADDPLVRTSLVMMLTNTPGCIVVDHVDSATLIEEYEEGISQGVIDVIVWDLGWNPEEYLPEWRELPIVQDGFLPIVVLLADNTPVTIAWTDSVRALLPRYSEAEKLQTAVQAAVQGLLVLDPTLAQAILPINNNEVDPLLTELTPREQDVLQLLTEGLTNKAIAQQLNISGHTVKFHVNAIMSKLNAQSRTEAVVRATRLGLIHL